MLAVLFINIALASPGTGLTVRPMAAPKPALRYQLLPEVRELNPGNSVQWYLRCFAEQRNFFFSKQGVEERNKYRAMTLAELAKQNLKNYGGSALTQADWAARLETPDWEVLRKVQEDGADFRMPELESLRVLAISLQVRFRAEVAREDYDSAIRTAKTMFAFARHLGLCPTLAANLLGLEVANLALDTLEELIQQPHAPNLYWPLTDLPAPLVDFHKGFQGERTRMDTELCAIRGDEPMTDEQLEAFVAKLSGRIGFTREQAGRPPKNVRAAIRTRVEDRERAVRIRNRLLKESPADGVAEKVSALKVLAFPPLQLILLEEKADYEAKRDESLKLLALAPWQLDALGELNPGDGLFADFLPSVAVYRKSQARVEQRIALLRCIEAIRHFAATHDGKLPEKQESSALPVPADPFTRKEFGYSVVDSVVHLTGAGKNLEIRLKK